MHSSWGRATRSQGSRGGSLTTPPPPNLNPLRSALLSRLRVRSPRLDLASEEQVRSKDSQCAPIAGQGKTASAELSAPDLMAEEEFAARHFMQEGGAPPALGILLVQAGRQSPARCCAGTAQLLSRLTAGETRLVHRSKSCFRN